MKKFAIIADQPFVSEAGRPPCSVHIVDESMKDQVVAAAGSNPEITKIYVAEIVEKLVKKQTFVSEPV